MVVYQLQEKLIFHPDILPHDYQYQLDQAFEEITLTNQAHEKINVLLFKAEKSKGLIVYYHGNAGNLAGWGDIAPMYTAAGFDFLIFDYQGFGKSTGKITNQKEFLEDAELIYNFAKTLRDENEITVIGYSIGSGPASYVASKNQPKQLVLMAPYYSLLKLAQEHTKWLPVKWIFKYPIPSYKYLENCLIPITVFHGTKDEVIPVHHGRLLKKKHQRIRYVELEDHQHSGMNEHQQFRAFISQLE